VLIERPLHIRQAAPIDAKVLTDLSYTTFWDAFAHHPKNAPDDLAHYMRQAFSIEQITAELADPRSIFLLGEIERKAVGYAKLVVDNIEPGITAERPVELSRLYSHQEFLGKGVGQNLMEACFERARVDGHDVMWLGVWEYNPRAQRFYEKNGFRVVGKHTFQLGSDPQTDLLMQKKISPQRHKGHKE
jgi:GNAT superfamily N-acetyltransferase